MNKALLDYLPGVLREVNEYKRIFGSEQIEIDALWQALEDALNNQFVLYATEEGISRWEKMLSLPVLPNYSLHQRRMRVLSCLGSQLPYTYRALLQYLSSYSESFDVKLYNNEYFLKIKILLRGVIPSLEKTLRRTIPANIILDLQQSILHETRTRFPISAAVMITQNRHRHVPQLGG